MCKVRSLLIVFSLILGFCFGGSTVAKRLAPMISTDESVNVSPINQKKFDDLAQQWLEHCDAVAFHSAPEPFLDCQAYRDLVKHGKPAIPYIMRVYKDVYFGPRGIGHEELDFRKWSYLMQSITGVKPQYGQAEDESYCREERKFWINWCAKKRISY